MTEDVKKLRDTLFGIYDLVFKNFDIPKEIREDIYKLIIIDANLDPNRRDV